MLVIHSLIKCMLSSWNDVTPRNTHKKLPTQLLLYSPFKDQHSRPYKRVYGSLWEVIALSMGTFSLWRLPQGKTNTSTIVTKFLSLSLVLTSLALCCDSFMSSSFFCLFSASFSFVSFTLSSFSFFLAGSGKRKYRRSH